MHERRRVQRARALPASSLPTCEHPKLSVDARIQLVHRFTIPGTHGLQQACDVAAIALAAHFSCAQLLSEGWPSPPCFRVF